MKYHVPFFGRFPQLKTWLCLLSFLIGCQHVQAQYNTVQNNVWVFGYKAGLDFNSGTPVPIVTGQPWFPEGSASVCDGSGNLLFYTDGRRVFNRAGHLMMNGDSVSFMETWSSICAAAIVPVPGNSNQYYLFSQEQFEYYTIPSNGRLAYSIIDMTLDSGLGGVLPTASGVMIDSGMTEKMVTIRGDNCNVWVVTHKSGSAAFSAYSVSSSGISPAVVSVSGTCITGGFPCYMAGGMNATHDGRTIVTMSYHMEFHDFDPATGVVSNSRVIDTTRGYMMEFSPDDTKMYTGDQITGGGAYVVQFDISLPTPAAIAASKTILATWPSPSFSLKLGRDNKIYIPGPAPGYSLDRINNPNLAGTACGYVVAAVPLVAPDMRASLGLPMTVINFEVSVSGGGAVCVGGSMTVTPSLPGGVWTSSNPAVATVNTMGAVTGIGGGTASISYTLAGCTAVATVSVVATPAAIGGVTTACVGYGNLLSSASTSGTWSSGTTSIATINPTTGIFTGIAPGSAVISYTLAGGCPAAVTTVNIISALPPIESTSSVLCIGDTLHLSNPITGGTWTSTAYFATVTSAGGLLRGMFDGMTMVIYTLGFGCVVSANYTVDFAPDAGDLSGPDTVCVSTTITALPTMGGGTWTIAGTNATVDASGNVTGVMAGTCILSYIVSTTCGADTAFFPITIYPAAHCGIAAVSNLANSGEDIAVYPTPSTGRLTLNSRVPFGNATITISNMVGATVLQREAAEHDTIMEFDLRHLANGTYFIKVTRGNNRVMKKIVLCK